MDKKSTTAAVKCKGEKCFLDTTVENNWWKTVKNPLIEHHLVTLRNKETETEDFSRAIVRIAKLLVFAVAQDWETDQVRVTTPFVETNALVLKKPVVLIPILRAGLALLEGFRDLIPDAKIGHIGLYRNKSNFQACEYYFKIPELSGNEQIVILDPMVATANTVIAAIKRLRANHPDCQISLVSVITSTYAKKRIDQVLKGVKVYTVSIDPELNKKKYIIPGFGDAGDRFFGT